MDAGSNARVVGVPRSPAVRADTAESPPGPPIDIPAVGVPVSLGPRPSVRRTVAFACLAMFVCYLPFSTVNAALGPIAAATGADTSQLQWMTDAFAVTLSVSVLPAGVLGDLYGRRRVALSGLALTALGAVVGLLAGGAGSAAVGLVWVGQAVAGAGGGAVMSSTLALIAAAAPDPVTRGRWIAGWAASVTLGLGGGPFLAALMTAHAGWRWLFAPTAVAAAVVAVFGAAWSDTSTASAGRRLDMGGQVTSGVGIAAAIFAVINVGSAGWSAPATITAAAVAALGLAGFVSIEHRASSPLLDLRLFHSPGFTGAGIAAAAVLFSIGGGAFVLSLFFHRQHLSGLDIALRLGFLFAGNVLASVAAGRAQTRLGPRTVLVAGLCAAAVGSGTLLTVSDATGLFGFGWRLAILGAGCGAVLATASAVAVASVPAPLAGMAGAGNNALRQAGAALGPAVLGLVLATRLDTDPSGALRLTAGVLTGLFTVTAVSTAAVFGCTGRRD